VNDVSSIALIVSIVSLLGTLTTVVRLFTKTEVRVDVIDERGKETAALARQTADKFNGEAHAAHTSLVARVTAVEGTVQRLATNERVDAVLARMEQGFKHLEDVIRREVGKTRED
jgi:hypothetical protein